MDAELKYYIALQPKIREAMGEEGIYDGRYCEAQKRHLTMLDCQYECPEYYKNCECAIRLPLPIDPRCPERGLWGMVDWSYWSFEDEGNGNARVSGGGEFVFVGTPELVLLKALAWQEGIKVEG